jgi:hypothetical protein
MTSAVRKHFDVRSARNAAFFRSDRPWAAISITSGHGHPVLSEANRVGLLRLVFDDITQPDIWRRPPGLRRGRLGEGKAKAR